MGQTLLFKKEDAMPLESLIVAGLITAVFIAFGLVLAWGSRQTRELPQHEASKPSEYSPRTQPNKVVRVLVDRI